MSRSVSHALALPRLGLAGTAEREEPIFTKSFNWGFVASFALRTNLYLLTVIMTAYCMARYGADICTASLATGIFTIGCVVARFVGGPITDRLGIVPTTLWGLGLTAGASMLYLAAGSMAAVIAIRAIHGLCYGVASTTVTSIASVNVPASRHGEGMGYFMLSVTLASAVGPVLGIGLTSGSDYTLLFVIAAVIAVAAMVATVLAGPVSDEHAEEADEVEDVTSLEAGAPSVSFADDGIRPVPTPRPLARFLEMSVMPIGIVAFLGYLIYGAVSAYLDPFAEQAGLVGPASLFFVAYALSMLISRPFTSKLLDTRGPVPLIVPGFIALGAGIGLMAAATTGEALLAAALLVGFGMGSIQPTGLALATKYLARSRYTVANATFYMMGDLATGIAPIVFGLIVPFTGYRGLFLGLVAVAAAGLMVFEGLHRAHRL